MKRTIPRFPKLNVKISQKIFREGGQLITNEIKVSVKVITPTFAIRWKTEKNVHHMKQIGRNKLI